MTSDVAHGEAELPEVVHPLPRIGPRQYVMIGAILTVITGIELWVSYSSLGDLIIPILLILSAVKFVVVVAFFMHLRFDNQALTRFFVFGFALAAAILFALISMFWNDATWLHGSGEAGAAAAAASEGAATSSESSGGGAAAAATLSVGLGEFHVSVGSSVSAGSTTFKVTDEGQVPHNLRVIRTDLAPDALPVSGATVDESQVEVVASVPDLNPGESGEATATLEPGTYVLICNVPGHYQLGMHTQITVQ